MQESETQMCSREDRKCLHDVFFNKQFFKLDNLQTGLADLTNSHLRWSFSSWYIISQNLTVTIIACRKFSEHSHYYSIKSYHMSSTINLGLYTTCSTEQQHLFSPYKNHSNFCPLEICFVRIPCINGSKQLILFIEAGFCTTYSTKHKPYRVSTCTYSLWSAKI